MKDKQTKRVEALKRLSQNIDKLRQEGNEIRVKIKNAKNLKESTPRSVMVVLARAVATPEDLHSSLEKIERRIAKATREATHIQQLITGNRKV